MAEMICRLGDRCRLSRERWLLFGPALMLVMLIWSAPYVEASVRVEGAVSSAAATGELALPAGNYVGADYWREVTRGTSGYTPTGGQEAGVLINRAGEAWRETRLETVMPVGQWLLAGTLGLLAVFYLVVGKNRLHEPRTGETIERWRKRDRWLHWTLASLFLILGITGLSILYGKYFLIDVLGQGGFAGYMQFAKLAHNYLGPLFIVNLVLMLVCWVRNNFFTGLDIRWFLQGGGMIKGKHPSAGYMNGGEKLWFWILVTGGLVISISGVVMDFPNLQPLRTDLQLANIVHALGSLVLICAAFGHIYIGSIGTEGALEGMVNGHVDRSWAKQHHDLWAKEVEEGRRK